MKEHYKNSYNENKIFSIDPFVSIDDGVGDLVKIAVEKGRKQNCSARESKLERWYI